jgi:hypothetical protein
VAGLHGVPFSPRGHHRKDRPTLRGSVSKTSVNARVQRRVPQPLRRPESDWNVFLGHAGATLAKFKVPEAEQSDVVAFVQSLKKDIVE